MELVALVEAKEAPAGLARVDPLSRRAELLAAKATKDSATGATGPSLHVVAKDLAVEDMSFWHEREVLTHVHGFARARMVSPWATLGVVLARVVTAVPPFVVLPPIVGGEASLNLFVALVGPSGAGKGAAERVAADALDVGDIDTAHVGSGEGLSHLFARLVTENKVSAVEQYRQAVLFSVPEVDNLTALRQRQGSTLLPQLRMAWSGERLGFAYADRSKALTVDAHRYRLGLVLGVQPGRAADLLDDSDGGTPQRFLWLPTTDPHMVAGSPEPEPRTWSLREPWQTNVVNGKFRMDVPDTARQTIVAARLAAGRGEDTSLDGHALLAREKVAAALALLDGRQGVSEDDWRLAGTVMAVSDATRAGVQRFLADRYRDANVARAQAEGQRAVVVEETVAAASLGRVCATILRRLGRSEGWSTRRDVAAAITSKDRGNVDSAIAHLVSSGQVEQQNDANGKPLYRSPAR
jgi:hypothetical protein